MLPIVSAVLAAVAPAIAVHVVDRLVPSRSPDPGVPPPRHEDLRAIALEVAHDPAIRRAAEQAAASVAKPWWTSKTVLGGVGVVLMSFGSLVGFAISSEDAGAIAEHLDKITTGLLGLWAIYGRIVARSPLR